MYHKLSDCILQGDKLAPRSVGAFWNGCVRCGLGGALLATGWPVEIPFMWEEIASQWPWLDKVNPEGNGVGTFGDYLSARFELVFWGHMTIEDYAAGVREWERQYDEALREELVCA